MAVRCTRPVALSAVLAEVDRLVDPTALLTLLAILAVISLVEVARGTFQW